MAVFVVIAVYHYLQCFVSSDNQHFENKNSKMTGACLCRKDLTLTYSHIINRSGQKAVIQEQQKYCGRVIGGLWQGRVYFLQRMGDSCHYGWEYGRGYGGGFGVHHCDLQPGGVELGTRYTTPKLQVVHGLEICSRIMWSRRGGKYTSNLIV